MYLNVSNNYFPIISHVFGYIFRHWVNLKTVLWPNSFQKREAMGYDLMSSLQKVGNHSHS